MKKKKSKRVYEVMPEGYYDAGIKSANSYMEDEREFVEGFSRNTQLELWILSLMEHLPKGATAWDIVKCLPRRGAKPEDIPATDTGEEIHINRKNPEGSISACLSQMHSIGLVRWRNEGMMTDADGNPIDGGDMRLGGYGAPRRVYEIVPPDERDDVEEKRKQASNARRAERKFIREGAAAIQQAQKANDELSKIATEARARIAQLETEQNIIRQHFDLPEWLLVPGEFGRIEK